MTDPLAPITRGRGRGLSFSLGGIPVTINLSILLVLAFLGFQLGDPALIAVFVIVGLASVLLHELGHAVAARIAGFSPIVELAGMGGVTTYHGDTSRAWSLVITAAGPAVQIAAGAIGMVFTDGFGLVYRGNLVEFGLSAWVVVSMVWGVLNLVPILPLDGGQLLQGAMPGPPRTRGLIAHGISVVVAVVGLGWALVTGQTWLALLAGFFGYTNIMSFVSLRGPAVRSADTSHTAQALLAQGQQLLAGGDASGWGLVRAAVAAPGPAAVRSVAASTLVEGLLRAGRDRAAYQAAADQRPGITLDEVVMARALSAHPNQVGVRRVVLTWAHQRNDARGRGIAALLLAWGGDFQAADQWIGVGPVAPAVVAAVDALRRRPHPPAKL